ncbi:GMP synthase, large subunit [mine drainage metagenome]|uniref:GMP synthase, large subunit n=1 Tax=mine drainage metagenome TaxID=410659 RepID=T0Y894_9ZZZZ
MTRSPPVSPAGVTGTDERVLILDYGSQYTQLIARRVRELGVYAEIHPGDWDGQAIARFAPRAIILSGGPASVLDEGSLRIPEAVFALGVPLLGICYGMQALALQLGGEVEEGWPREYGSAEVELCAPSLLFEGISGMSESSGRLAVWMSHGIRVKKCRQGSRSWPETHPRRLRPSQTRRGSGTGSSSTRKCVTRPQGRTCS